MLASLPEYFTPDTHDTLRWVFAAAAVWVADDDVNGDSNGSDVVGFALVESRFAGTAEITYAAVVPERQGRGIGMALVEAALATLREQGVAVVEVKTLDASAGYSPYERTRAFWERRGFQQIDCIDPLPGWRPGNPAAIYVAALNTTRPT